MTYRKTGLPTGLSTRFQRMGFDFRTCAIRPSAPETLT
jgi:hypothetical protein